MNELVDGAAKALEEFAASVEFDTSELTADELLRPPSLDEDAGDDSPLIDGSPAAGGSAESAAVPATDDSGHSHAADWVALRWIDRVLTLVNRPFAKLRPPVRKLTGQIAMVTIFTAVLFLIVRPLLFERRDLLDSLRESVAEIEDTPLAGRRPTR